MNLLDAWSTSPGGAARPFVTYYDLRSGERVELSGTTVQNWVSKAANFLVDEFDAEPGVRLHLGIETHWLRAVLLLAGWTVGATITDAEADIAVTGPDLDLSGAPGATHRAAASLRPLGAPFASPFAGADDGFVDLGLALPGQPDDFFALDPPQESDLAVDVAGRRLTQAQLLAAVEPSPERLLFAGGSLARDIDALVAAGRGGGSLVWACHGDDRDLERLAPQEQAQIR